MVSKKSNNNSSSNNNTSNGNGSSTKTPSFKQQQSDDKKDYSSLKTVLFYCALIVFLPISTFFCFKGYLLSILFTMDDVEKSIYSALGAVIALHVALGIFVYRAYFGSSHVKAD